MADIERIIDADAMSLRQRFPDLGRKTYIMGILNVTPDSFSDGGRFSSSKQAVAAAQAMVVDGADIIDIGGESTRPGARAISAQEELDRVLPTIEALVADKTPALLSIDTTKADVARAAVEAGAHMVNDVSAMTFDAAMPATVAELEVPVVLSHTRDRPEVMQKGNLKYAGGVVASVGASLRRSVQVAMAAGVAPQNIVVDPGIGFGKTVDDNLELLRNLSALRGLVDAEEGLPVLVGPSRKSFLGALTDRPIDHRMVATMAVVARSVSTGADFV
ncbi:MAG: dihydropteroate synthase, partial [Myxococcota bacterium]